VRVSGEGWREIWVELSWVHDTIWGEEREEVSDWKEGRRRRDGTRRIESWERKKKDSLGSTREKTPKTGKQEGMLVSARGSGGAM